MKPRQTAIALCVVCLAALTACTAETPPASSIPATSLIGQGAEASTSRPEDSFALPQLTAEELTALPSLTGQEIEPLFSAKEEWAEDDPLALEGEYEEVRMEDPLRPHIWIGSRLYSYNGYQVSYKIAMYDEYDPYISEWVWDGESIYLDNAIPILTGAEYKLACGLQVGMPLQQAIEILSGYRQYGGFTIVDITANRQALELDSTAVEGAEALQWEQYYPGLFSGYAYAASIPVDSTDSIARNLCLYFGADECLAAITLCELGR